MDSPHKVPVMQKALPCNDSVMSTVHLPISSCLLFLNTHSESVGEIWIVCVNSSKFFHFHCLVQSTFIFYGLLRWVHKKLLVYFSGYLISVGLASTYTSFGPSSSTMYAIAKSIMQLLWYPIVNRILLVAMRIDKTVLPLLSLHLQQIPLQPKPLWHGTYSTKYPPDSPYVSRDYEVWCVLLSS